MLSDKIIESIIPISIISLILLIVIFIIRIIFYILIFMLSSLYLKNRRKRKAIAKKKTDIVIYKKEDEELHRDLEKERKIAKEQFNLQGVERMGGGGDTSLNSMDERENVKVVGIAKPVGFWTSLVLGDQLSQIIDKARALNNRSHKGFWVSMLEAQMQGLGKSNDRHRSV